MQSGAARSALAGKVTEVDIATEDFDADLQAFLANHLSDMLDMIQKELYANV
jgi:hypothetical protein